MPTVLCHNSLHCKDIVYKYNLICIYRRGNKSKNQLAGLRKPFPPRAFQKVLLKQKLTCIFIFSFLCGASKGFIKAFKAFRKPFEESQNSVKKKT